MASRGRRRVGVVLLLDGPVADEVQGIRRALGDGTIARIDPHVTLISPLNLRDHELAGALAHLRRVAAAAPPTIEMTIGPVRTFAPANPVLYLAVDAPPDTLGALRAQLFAPPLQRASNWPWVPHVTVADDVAPTRIPAAMATLDAYGERVTFDRLVMLELLDGKWGPLADVALGPPARVGTGGFALELTRSRLLDPEAGALLDAIAGSPVPRATDPTDPTDPTADDDGTCGGGRRPPVVITARSGGLVCGVGAGWIDDAGGHVGIYVAEGLRRQGVGRHLLAAVESAVASAGWHCGVLQADHSGEFFAAVSARPRGIAT